VGSYFAHIYTDVSRHEETSDQRHISIDSRRVLLYISEFVIPRPSYCWRFYLSDYYAEVISGSCITI